MLKKITKIQQVGLFQSGTPSPVSFNRATLIYGENGRGKSTLSAMLRACSKGDTASVVAKKTIDSAGEPELSLLFEAAGKNAPAEFAKGAWSGHTPNILVFDSAFVEQNVYSGFEVRADQRQALLGFALGDQTVALRKKIDAVNANIDIATRKRTEAEKEVLKYSQQMPVAQFIKLKEVEDAQQQIDGIQKRIEAARNAQTLGQRQNPVLLTLLEFNTEAFFGILGKELEKVQQTAEETVKAHFAKHAVPPGIEHWVSQGQEYAAGTDCPYCGQSLDGQKLIQAYKGYFNEAYATLKKEVEVLRRGAETRLSDAKIDSLLSI